jgi:hypothetical protein
MQVRAETTAIGEVMPYAGKSRDKTAIGEVMNMSYIIM